MRHKETKPEVKEVVTVVREWLTCDWCDQEIKVSSIFDLQEGFVSQVSKIEGESYPECGNKEDFRADLCNACIEKVITLLSDQGIKFYTVENDW